MKRLVEGHGGAVGVRGAPQGGALFFFELPLAPPKAESLAGAPGVRAPVPST